MHKIALSQGQHCVAQSLTLFGHYYTVLVVTCLWWRCKRMLCAVLCGGDRHTSYDCLFCIPSLHRIFLAESQFWHTPFHSVENNGVYARSLRFPVGPTSECSIEYTHAKAPQIFFRHFWSDLNHPTRDQTRSCVPKTIKETCARTTNDAHGWVFKGSILNAIEAKLYLFERKKKCCASRLGSYGISREPSPRSWNDNNPFTWLCLRRLRLPVLITRVNSKHTNDLVSLIERFKGRLGLCKQRPQTAVRTIERVLDVLCYSTGCPSYHTARFKKRGMALRDSNLVRVVSSTVK